MAALTRDKYIEVLRRHGRRVANRVALASMTPRGRTLTDFYACYSPEADLPDHEKCSTDLIHMFDPSGWFVYYTGPRYDLHPEPPKTDEDIE